MAPKPYYELIDGELRLSSPEPLTFWKRALIEGVQRSRLLELVNEARRQWSVRKRRADQEARLQSVEAGLAADIYRSPDESRDLADAWALTERLLAELHRKVRIDGARFAVATVPAAVQTHPDTAYRKALAAELDVDDLLMPERQVADFGRDDSYVVFPLVEALQSKVGDRHFHGFANSGYGLGHMNAEGHRAMAELLTEKLCDELDQEPGTGSMAVARH